MRPNGLGADRQSAPDLALTMPCGDKLEDLALSLGENHFRALRVRGKEGIDVPRATGGRAQRTQQILYRCLLQKDRTCSGAKYFGGQLGRSIARVHDDACAGRGCKDVFDELDAASPGHAVIENGHIGLGCPDSLDGIPAVCVRRHDVVAVFLEEIRDGCEESGVVVGNDAADAL